MKVVMVTGASGFVGTHVVKYFREHGLKVVAVLHDEVVWTKWLQESLADTVRVKGDVRDTRFIMRVLNQYGVTDVLHLAAQSIVKRAHKDPVNTYSINIMGTVSVLEACRQLQIPKTIIQSTDKAYGNQMDASNECALRPTEPYGTSKICGDLIAQTYKETYCMHVIVTRPCNIFGYDPCNDRIVPNTIKACLSGKSPTIFRNDESKRQYVYIDDVAEIMFQLLTMEDVEETIVNIASPTVLSQAEVVNSILQFFPHIKPTLQDKPPLKEIHSQSMALYMHTESPTEFTEGIRKTIEAFRKYGGGRF